LQGWASEPFQIKSGNDPWSGRAGPVTLFRLSLKRFLGGRWMGRARPGTLLKLSLKRVPGGVVAGRARPGTLFRLSLKRALGGVWAGRSLFRLSLKGSLVALCRVGLGQ